MHHPAVHARRPLLARPRAILFDLDGTLVDTMPAFADVAADVMVSYHGLDRAAARRAYLATSGVPFFQQLEQIAPGHAANAGAAARFERDKLVATAQVRCSPATEVALHRLRLRGIAVVVSSNNFQAQVDRFVERCGASFDLALGFGDGLAKGASHFDRACHAFGCPRGRLLFVGDSLADARLALAEGVRFVGCLGTNDADAFRAVAPDAPLIASIDELLALLT